MQAYERIEFSLKSYEKPVGPFRLYKRVLNECNGNEKMADSFMLSEYGLFTKKELRRIKTVIKYRKKKYHKEKACDPL